MLKFGGVGGVVGCSMVWRDVCQPEGEEGPVECGRLDKGAGWARGHGGGRGRGGRGSDVEMKTGQGNGNAVRAEDSF